MKRKSVILVVAVVLPLGCTNSTRNRANPAADSQKAEPTPPYGSLSLTQANKPATAVGPHGIEVNVLLSDQAKSKLLGSKETIIVAGSVTGFPRKGTRKKCNDEITVEMAPGGVARFRDVELPEGCIGSDVQGARELGINVASGRKSSPDNLLNCDFYEGNLSDIQGRRIDITCSLIGEH